MRLTLILLSTALAAAQGLQNGSFEDRQALLLSNDKLELAVFTQGGALANLVLRDDPEKLSPLWNPIRYARETGRQQSGFAVGHFVCVDGFGPVSAEERDAGLPGHGEAHTLPWETSYSGKEGRTLTLTQKVRLPLHQETFTRSLRLVDGENVIYVQSELASHLSFDRPVNWAEHATIGAPFLEPELTVVDMPARQAQTRSHGERSLPQPHRLPPSVDFTWPMSPAVAGKKIDLRAAPRNPNSLDHTTCRLDPARPLVFVTALHTGKRLLLGYLFRREEYPWLQSWEHYPPDGRMARGLEFSTQPFDVPRREAIQTGMLFDTPTYRWLPAKSKIESRFLVFYTRVPEGFRKVDDVKLEGGALVVEDRKARKQVKLAASLGL
ncbi:MAG: hypothetical protein HYR60_32685 [Acidobacteria bacterium]|nr:hypothetical protein [Acidobacteriota bacterium]